MNEELLRLEIAYLSIIEPEKLVGDMSYDEFCDWVELGTKSDIECSIREFERSGMYDHVKVMKIILKNKYDFSL